MASIRASVRHGRYHVSASGRLTAGDLVRLERACGPALAEREIPLELSLGAVTGLDETAQVFHDRLVARGARITSGPVRGCSDAACENTARNRSARDSAPATMLQSIQAIQRFTIHAVDGGIGHVDEVYFDDEAWVVRYVVVDTGHWLPDRRVLLSPFAVRSADWPARVLEVSLTREQIRQSPDVDTHKPVSRQKELEHLRHYGYPSYWNGPWLWGVADLPAASLEMARSAEMPPEPSAAPAAGDIHLRSTREVAGYRLHANDGDIGHVEDFLFADESWAIRYIVVNTSNWWMGRRVLVASRWIRGVSWTDAMVSVDVAREEIRSAPEHDWSTAITRDFEERLHRHYGRRGYWQPAADR